MTEMVQWDWEATKEAGLLSGMRNMMFNRRMKNLKTSPDAHMTRPLPQGPHLPGVSAKPAATNVLKPDFNKHDSVDLSKNSYQEFDAPVRPGKVKKPAIPFPAASPTPPKTPGAMPSLKAAAFTLI